MRISAEEANKAASRKISGEYLLGIIFKKIIDVSEQGFFSLTIYRIMFNIIPELSKPMLNAIFSDAYEYIERELTRLKYTVTKNKDYITISWNETD